MSNPSALNDQSESKTNHLVKGRAITKALLMTLLSTTLLGACSMKQPENELQGMAGVAINLERTMSGLERKELQIDGFVIPFLQGGQGEPLVLIHGFGGSKDNWNRVSKHLTKEYTVYAVDLPGFGAATRDEQASYLIPEQVERLHEIIEKLGLKKVHLAGNSMGGYIAGTYAAKYPEETASVWFLAPAGLAESAKSEVLQTYAKTGQIVLTASNVEEFNKIVEIVMFKKPAFAPGFVVEAMAERSARDQALHQKIYRSFKDAPPILDKTMAESQYKGPALIVWGKQDRVLHVDGAAELKAAMPQASVELLDETGHVPMMERPEQVAKSYISWRKGLAGSN